MSLYTADEQAELFEAYCQDDEARVSTGYPALDKFMRGGGMAPGDMVMLLGRSGVGKSFFLQNLINNVAKQRVGILDISLEMTVEQKVSRLACIQYGLDPAKLEHGIKAGYDTTLHYLAQYRREFPKYAILKPSSVDGAGFEEFSKAVEDYDRMMGERPRVVALDFLGLCKRSNYDGAEQQRIPRLAAMAERWADAEGVSLIVLHQTGRANEGDSTKRNHGHIPLTMEDAMYGGEQNADYMFGAYRPELEPAPNNDPYSEDYLEWGRKVQKERGRIYIQLLKNRHGPRPVESQFPGIPFRWEWPSGLMEPELYEP